MQIEFDETNILKSVRDEYDVIGVGSFRNCPTGAWVTWGRLSVARHHAEATLDDYDLCIYLKPKPKRRQPTIQDAVDRRECIVKKTGKVRYLHGYIQFADNIVFYASDVKNDVVATAFGESELYIEE